MRPHLDLRLGRAEDLVATLPAESLDVTITSPPYNLGYEKPHHAGGAQTMSSGYGEFDDRMDEDEYQASQVSLLSQLYGRTRPGGSLFYIHQIRTKLNRRNSRGKIAKVSGEFSSPLDWLRRTPWTIVQELVWHRGAGSNHQVRRFTPVDERVYWLVRLQPGVKLEAGVIRHSTVLDFPKATQSERGPCPAPFATGLVEVCLDAVEVEDLDRPLLVCDPYSGSGTTALIALLRGHRFVGSELDPATHAHAIQRISAAQPRAIEPQREVAVA